MVPITSPKTSFLLLALFPFTAISSPAHLPANSKDALPQPPEVLDHDVKRNYGPNDLYRPVPHKGDPERKTADSTSISSSTTVVFSSSSNTIMSQGSSTAVLSLSSMKASSGTSTLSSTSNLSSSTSSTGDLAPTSTIDARPIERSSSSELYLTSTITISPMATSGPGSVLYSTSASALSTISTSNSMSIPFFSSDNSLSSILSSTRALLSTSTAHTKRVQTTSSSVPPTSIMVLPPISRVSTATSLSSTSGVSSISKRDPSLKSTSTSISTVSPTSTADESPIPVASTSDSATITSSSIILIWTTPATSTSDPTSPTTPTLDATSPASPTPSLDPDNSSKQPEGSGYDNDTDFMNRMLAAHNFFRTEHNAPPIVWNYELAQSAQDWVKNCQFAHAPGKDDYGENLAQGYPNVAASVNGWGLERLNYDYDNPGFSPSTGHFTQVVWKETGTVGCGRKDCATGVGGWLVYCLYNEPGNWDGEYQANVRRQTNGDSVAGAPE